MPTWLIFESTGAAMFSAAKFSVILWGLQWLLRYAAWRSLAFRARLAERNLNAQILARDEEIGRWFAVRDGKLTSGRGRHPKPDVTLSFKTAAIGVELPEDLTNWFAQTLMLAQTAGWRFGTRLPDGTTRTCNMTNGGPVFVYVKDGKIVRMTPIEFGEDDPAPWTIRARGIDLTPPRKTTLAPHGQNAKSIVYSPDRLLHPLRR